MTVKELIQQLDNLPEDLPVCMNEAHLTDDSEISTAYEPEEITGVYMRNSLFKRWPKHVQLI